MPPRTCELRALRPGLAGEQLGARIGDKAAPREVVPMAHALSERIAQRFQLAMLPRRPPDLRRGRALYRQALRGLPRSRRNSARRALELPTRPTAFSSRQEVARLSPQRIFAAVSSGCGDGDAFVQRRHRRDTMWDVAFAALLFAHPREEQVRGEEVARSCPGARTGCSSRAHGRAASGHALAQPFPPRSAKR